MSMSLVPGQLDVLLLSAHAPHVAGLRPLLGDLLSGHVLSARVATKTAGIGVSAAAVGTARRLMQTTPRAVVFVGVAGAYPSSGCAPRSVVIPTRVTLAGGPLAEGRAFFPDPMQTAVTPHATLSSGLAHDPRTKRAAAATPLGWTLDDALASGLAIGTGAQVESLEAFSVGQAAALLDVPFAAVLGVSHEAGRHAKDHMREHERAAAEAACETVAAWLQGGAQGLPAA